VFYSASTPLPPTTICRIACHNDYFICQGENLLANYQCFSGKVSGALEWRKIKEVEGKKESPRKRTPATTSTSRVI
jgi:hypothetical protein